MTEAENLKELRKRAHKMGQEIRAVIQAPFDVSDPYKVGRLQTELRPICDQVRTILNSDPNDKFTHDYDAESDTTISMVKSDWWPKAEKQPPLSRKLVRIDFTNGTQEDICDLPPLIL